MNAFPILARAHDYFGAPGSMGPRPCIGAAVGSYYISNRVEVGLVAINETNWHLGFAPDPGIVLPLSGDTVAFVNAHFNYVKAGGITHSYRGSESAWPGSPTEASRMQIADCRMETDKAANAAICFLRSVINTLHAALFLAAIPHQALGQETKSSLAVAVAGGALGLYSGAMLGTVGSIVPCSQTYSGARCVRWSAAVSGTIGLAGGLLVGAADQDRIATAGKSAGIGFLVGSAVGLGLKPFAQRFGWQDVAAVGLLGGAIGASPKGAGIGLGVGAAVGAVLSLSLSDFTFPDALGTALAGLTIGTLSGWVVDGIDAQTDSDSALHLAFPLTVPF